jgi:hypothetical protein
MDLARQAASYAILLSGKVKVALKIEPELRGDAKVASETQRSVCRDAPVSMIDSLRRSGAGHLEKDLT